MKAFPDEPHFKFMPSFDVTGLSFDSILKKLDEYEKGINLPNGFVPDTLLFAFNNTGEIVGRVSIRHELNDYLRKYAGNLGYGVIPRFRRMGYATIILRGALDFCKTELKLESVLITCDENNVGSIKTIESSGTKTFTLYQDETLTVPKRHYLVKTK